MKKSVIDAHIHLDMYEEKDRTLIVDQLIDDNVDALISVSMNLASSQANFQLSKEIKQVKPAFGYHPEQLLPTEQELCQLIDFMSEHQKEMVAVGEVGLPYYLRQEKQSVQIDPYVELLELFIRQAVTLHKPIVLHAVYDDAPVVCDLLEKHSIQKAHFHWFKGDQKTIERMIENGYYISVTPDVRYEEEIQQIVKAYPLSHIMVETDGPWPFEGTYQGQLTHPNMLHKTIETIAQLKRQRLESVYQIIYKNTDDFYG